MLMPDFTLWLEFEEFKYPSTWDAQNEFCNIHVELPDGRRYGLNVWTYGFLATATRSETSSDLSGAYMIPPDLFVRELTRECIQLSICL